MKVVTVLVCLILFSGCATTNPLGPLPTDMQEYYLSKNELIEKYPDISVYEKNWRGFYPNYPLKKCGRSTR